MLLLFKWKIENHLSPTKQTTESKDETYIHMQTRLFQVNDLELRPHLKSLSF